MASDHSTFEINEHNGDGLLQCRTAEEAQRIVDLWRQEAAALEAAGEPTVCEVSGDDATVRFHGYYRLGTLSKNYNYDKIENVIKRVKDGEG